MASASRMRWVFTGWTLFSPLPRFRGARAWPYATRDASYGQLRQAKAKRALSAWICAAADFLISQRLARQRDDLLVGRLGVLCALA